MAKRPTGPARRARAFAQLLIELERVLEIIERPFTEQRAVVRPGLAQGDRLVTSVVAALRSSADVLAGGAKPAILVLEGGRVKDRAGPGRLAAQHRVGGGAG